MADMTRVHCSLGPIRGLSIDLTEAEYALLAEYATGRGVEPARAAAELFGDRLAELAKAMTGQRPSAAVKRFQRARQDRSRD